MLRRHKLLFSLSLLSAFALAAPRAEAASIPIIANFTCTDLVGAGTECGQSPSIPNSGDLTDGDTNLALVVHVTDIEPGSSWTASIYAGSGVDNDIVAVSGITGPTNAIFPFASFAGVDFHAIDALSLSLVNSSSPGDFVTVDLGAEVPEPSTAGMLMLGLVGLVAASPRKRLAV